MRVYQWLVNEKEHGANVYNAVRRGLPLMPHEKILQAFENRDVRMDDRRCRRDDKVLPGSSISVYSDYIPVLKVLYEDDNVLAIHKPGNLCVEDPCCGMSVVSLLTQDGREGLKLCHRLDTRTSGVLLSAKNDAAYACCRDAFAMHLPLKMYECLVRGTLDPEEAVLSAYLVKDAQKGKVRIVTHQSPGALPIMTGYRVMRRENGVSRLSVRLYTGRTHQIRAHLAFIGHPVIGDDLYGDRRLNRALGLPDLRLCSVLLRMNFPRDSFLGYLSDKEFTSLAPF